MDNVNKTLYIPLYGKSLVSKKGIILSDKKAEEIWDSESFTLKGKSRSKWLAYFLSMRAAVFDKWLMQKMTEDNKSIILHIGCGLDSRIMRVGTRNHLWYDIDFEDVITLRKKYYSETECYRMIVGDARSSDWLNTVPCGKNAIIIFEGISMYLKTNELQSFLHNVCEYFPKVNILMDCYTEKGAKATKIKNPINDVGVTVTYGIDDPKILEQNTGFNFIAEHNITPNQMINELNECERFIFRKLFGGKFSKSMYRMFEFKKGK